MPFSFADMMTMITMAPRQKTVCLARNTSNVLGVIGGTLENYFMNPNAWNLQGYTGFVWGGCAWIIFIWAYFRLPETKVRLSLLA
jgi:SP family general alpha glucoside:H+ symporter-like MFS transporter